MTQRPDGSQPGPSPTRWVICSLMVILIGYPLSIGPAVLFVSILEHYGNTGAVSYLNLAYYPLVLLANLSDPVRNLIEYYVFLWMNFGTRLRLL